MSASGQKKIQEHYDTIADVYDHHYDKPRGRCYHTHISTSIMNDLPKGGDSWISDAGPAFLLRDT